VRSIGCSLCSALCHLSATCTPRPIAFRALPKLGASSISAVNPTSQTTLELLLSLSPFLRCLLILMSILIRPMVLTPCITLSFVSRSVSSSHPAPAHSRVGVGVGHYSCLTRHHLRSFDVSSQITEIHPVIPLCLNVVLYGNAMFVLLVSGLRSTFTFTRHKASSKTRDATTM